MTTAATPASPATPSTNWFHTVLVKIENLLGLHPNDPAYAAAKAEIAEITKDKLTVEESAQLDKTLKAIEAARKPAAPPAPAAPAAPVAPVAPVAPPATGTP